MPDRTPASSMTEIQNRLASAVVVREASPHHDGFEAQVLAVAARMMRIESKLVAFRGEVADDLRLLRRSMTRLWRLVPPNARDAVMARITETLNAALTDAGLQMATATDGDDDDDDYEVSAGVGTHTFYEDRETGDSLTGVGPEITLRPREGRGSTITFGAGPTFSPPAPDEGLGDAARPNGGGAWIEINC